MRKTMLNLAELITVIAACINLFGIGFFSCHLHFLFCFPGRKIGSQSVEPMETASLRGRRRRQIPDEDESESLDDLLKTVDSKPVAKEEPQDDEKSTKEADNEAGSRRESVTKLPSGRQIKQQAVRIDFLF